MTQFSFAFEFLYISAYVIGMLFIIYWVLLATSACLWKGSQTLMRHAKLYMDFLCFYMHRKEIKEYIGKMTDPVDVLVAKTDAIPGVGFFHLLKTEWTPLVSGPTTIEFKNQATLLSSIFLQGYLKDKSFIKWSVAGAIPPDKLDKCWSCRLIAEFKKEGERSWIIAGIIDYPDPKMIDLPEFVQWKTIKC